MPARAGTGPGIGTGNGTALLWINFPSGSSPSGRSDSGTPGSSNRFPGTTGPRGPAKEQGERLAREKRAKAVTEKGLGVKSALIPEGVFFTKGVGKHRNRLQSFELALRRAGIEKCNLVRVSSILPPKCRIVPRQRGLDRLSPGQITFVVLAEASTNEPSRMVGAGIGLAQPASGQQYGYISEHHGFGMTEKRLADMVEDMAATMLATTLGIEFDPEIAYDNRKEIYRMSGKIVRSRACVQTAEGDKDGLWTTAIAAAVFLL